MQPTSKMSAPKAAPPPAPKPLQKEFSRSAPSAASPNGSQAVSNGKAVRVKFVIKQASRAKFVASRNFPSNVFEAGGLVNVLFKQHPGRVCHRAGK